MIDGKKVVLLIEDSEIVQELTKAALEEAGFIVKTALGNIDLEKKIHKIDGFLEGIDILVLDMELEEVQVRQREDKGGSHLGVYMTGSQIGAMLAFQHPQLCTVPFLLYSGHQVEEIRHYLDELEGFAECDEQIKTNYRGFIPKDLGAEQLLIEKINEILS